MAMTGLDKITGKILAEADKEAKKILSEADDACKEIEEESKTAVEAIEKNFADEAKRQREEFSARTEASAKTRRRNLLLATEGELVDEVFRNAEATVLSYDREKMLDLLTGLLANAMIEQVEAEAESIALYGAEDAVLPETYELIMNKKDRATYGGAMISGVGNKLIGKVPSEKLAKLRLSDTTKNISGGFILRYGDIESNCSFDLIFAELRQKLEIEVSRALFEGAKAQEGKAV
ncbi:MAG: hypothetical protein IJR88_04870 [Clostridia bacterium]|nr:hypothetical protein [Clostridia bacterium]